MQTRYIAKHPDRYKEVEAARWMGEHPTTKKVTQYFVASTALKLTVMHYLPGQWRTRFQYLIIGSTGSTVYRNDKIGIGLDVPFK